MTVCALYPQEAVGGVADPRGQNFVPEHGIDHGALPIARPARTTGRQGSILTCISGLHDAEAVSLGAQSLCGSTSMQTGGVGTLCL